MKKDALCIWMHRLTELCLLHVCTCTPGPYTHTQHSLCMWKCSKATRITGKARNLLGINGRLAKDGGGISLGTITTASALGKKEKKPAHSLPFIRHPLTPRVIYQELGLRGYAWGILPYQAHYSMCGHEAYFIYCIQITLWRYLYMQTVECSCMIHISLSL